LAKENVIAEKTFVFALKVISLYKVLVTGHKEYVLSKQILRSGTSIGANVNEALEAQSKADFVHKLSIALKEARETEYWLKLLIGSYFIDPDTELLNDIIPIIRILTAIILTTKDGMSTPIR